MSTGDDIQVTMHSDHDLDLISSLAGGDPIDRPAAEELIAGCEECASLYRAHRAVLEAVAEEPPVSLTDLERRRLRTDVWAAIEPEPVGVGPRRWWLTRLLPAAAALAFVVAVGAVLNQPGGDATFTVAAEVGGAADTTAPSVETLSGLPQEPTEDTTASEAPVAPADTFTDSAADEDSAGEESAGEESAKSASIWPVEEFRDRVVAGEAEIDQAFPCEPNLEGRRLLAAEAYTRDTQRVWLVAVENRDRPDILVLDRDECSLLESHE